MCNRIAGTRKFRFKANLTLNAAHIYYMYTYIHTYILIYVYTINSKYHSVMLVPQILYRVKWYVWITFAVSNSYGLLMEAVNISLLLSNSKTFICQCIHFCLCVCICRFVSACVCVLTLCPWVPSYSNCSTLDWRSSSCRRL